MFYKIACSLFYITFKYLFRGKFYGLENIPEKGGFLLAGNHVSFLDPLFIAGCVIKKRNVYSFARKTLFKNKFLQWLYSKKLKMIPIDRDSGTDLVALKQVIKILKDGKGVMLFPEGSRSESGDIKSGKNGVGWFACQSQLPVVPVRIFGSYEAWNKKMKFPKIGKQIEIVFGKCIFPSDYYITSSNDKNLKEKDSEKDSELQDKKNRIRFATDTIMHAIFNLNLPKK